MVVSIQKNKCPVILLMTVSIQKNKFYIWLSAYIKQLYCYFNRVAIIYFYDIIAALSVKVI